MLGISLGLFLSSYFIFLFSFTAFLSNFCFILKLFHLFYILNTDFLPYFPHNPYPHLSSIGGKKEDSNFDIIRNVLVWYMMKNSMRSLGYRVMERLSGKWSEESPMDVWGWGYAATTEALMLWSAGEWFLFSFHK